jgi:hypothetical protein
VVVVVVCAGPKYRVALIWLRNAFIRLLYGPAVVYLALVGLVVGAALAVFGAGVAAVFLVMGVTLLWAVVALVAHISLTRSEW